MLDRPHLPPAWRLILLGSGLAAAGIAPLTVHGWENPHHAVPASVTAIALAGWCLSAGGLALRLGRTPWNAGPLRALIVGSSAAAATAVVDISAGSFSAPARAGVVAAAITLAAHLAIWILLRGRPARRVVLVGPLDCRLRLREHLLSHRELGYEIVAEVGPGTSVMADTPSHPLAELEQAVAAADPDEVLLSTGFDDRLLLMDVLARLLSRPLIVRYVPDPEAVPLFCPRPSDLAGLPAIDLSNGPISPGAEVLKWIEDKTVAIVALLVLGVPMLLIAAAIKLTSPGDVLFIQQRQGRWGRSIRVFKFRTMRRDVCSQDITTGRFKQVETGDPRITPLGRFLRNTSLDETPQFLNVLFGDMSVVGPRPHPFALNKRYASEIGELMRRHYVKPGITGLAQINGARGETRTIEDMRRRINLDLEYLRSWSLWLDVTIIFKTLFRGWINRQP